MLKWVNGLGGPPTLKTIREITDPAENARHRRDFDAFKKNGDWFEAHLDEILPLIRGKHIVVAGQELFFADTAAEVRAWAKEKHPEDPAPYFDRIRAQPRDFIG